MERVILHCDLNCFFASVELLAHPELRHMPVAVCGDPSSRHGVVLAKNEAAKQAGVKTAETIWQAQRKCPGLLLLPPHHQKYLEYSRRINAFYRTYTDRVEPFGIDESWLDVSETVHRFGGSGVALADDLRRRIREDLGLTISVGVSYNKIFAKLGSDYKKPDATTLIRPGDMESIVWPLPVSNLLFAGRSTCQALTPLGVKTIGDLARLSPAFLEGLLGKQGLQLHRYANGLDREPVAKAETYEPPRSIGNGSTFPQNLTKREDVRRAVNGLCDEIAARLRKEVLTCERIQVALRDPAFRDSSRQQPLTAPTQLGRELARAATALIDTFWQPGSPLRAITVTAQSLEPLREFSSQTDLFGAPAAPREKKEAVLEGTLDTIRAKYGKAAIGYWGVASEEAKGPDFTP